MKILARWALVLALLGVPLGTPSAQSATVTLSVTITSPPATAIACGTSNSYTLAAPVAPGTVICPFVIQPTGWSGILTLTQSGGPQANAFAVSGGAGAQSLVVGPVPLTTIGSYSLSITATP